MNLGPLKISRALNASSNFHGHMEIENLTDTSFSIPLTKPVSAVDFDPSEYEIFNFESVFRLFPEETSEY